MRVGNVQQQAAAAGALQALMYCPPGLDIAAGVASEGGIAPLLHMLGTGPLPLRSAAAAALCNLALASPHNQVRLCCTALISSPAKCMLRTIAVSVLFHHVWSLSQPACWVYWVPEHRLSKWFFLCLCDQRVDKSR